MRLRRAAGRAILTYKGPARFAGGVKMREERETAVSDPDEMEAILAALGFERRFRYEKRREEWTLEGCAVALDETPIGNFVEVEGDPRGDPPRRRRARPRLRRGRPLLLRRALRASAGRKTRRFLPTWSSRA